MNWIIRSTQKLKFHTNLNELLKPIEDMIGEFKWMLTDLEFIMDQPLDFLSMEKDMCILTPEQMDRVRKQHAQFVWGAIIAIPKSAETNLDELPFVEGNDNIWKNGNIQHEEGQIEIDCFDSGYTIVKFKDRQLSDTFKTYFEEAIELERYK